MTLNNVLEIAFSLLESGWTSNDVSEIALFLESGWISNNDLEMAYFRRAGGHGVISQ